MTASADLPLWDATLLAGSVPGLPGVGEGGPPTQRMGPASCAGVQMTVGHKARQSSAWAGPTPRGANLGQLCTFVGAVPGCACIEQLTLLMGMLSPAGVQ